MVLNRNLLSVREDEHSEDVFNTCFTVGIILLCIFILFTRFCWLYCVQVEGDSMNDTLQTGDMLLVNRLVEPKAGDVVVFELNGKNYIKRIIALGGDTVKYQNGNVLVKRAGEKEFLTVVYGEKGRTEPRIYPSNYGVELLIQEGYAYVLGDNRQNSTDSRVFGAIPLANVGGVVTQGVIDNRNTFWGRFYKYV